MRQINDPIQPGAEQILLPGLLSLPRPHRSPSLDHLEGKESQPPIRRNRKNNLQENRSAAAQFRQKPLLGKAQSPISFNALEILHGRHFQLRRHKPWWHGRQPGRLGNIVVGDYLPRGISFISLGAYEREFSSRDPQNSYCVVVKKRSMENAVDPQ
jgi:hypothetical protein